MTTFRFREPYLTVDTLDGYDGPIEIMGIVPGTTTCLARRADVDPTTQGTDYLEWETELDQADADRFNALANAFAVAPPHAPLDEFTALGGARDIKAALIGAQPLRGPAPPA